ncbi:EpsG family protein [Pasteurellaceae bacterium 22721_9_1]
MSIYIFILLLLILGSIFDLYNSRIKNIIFNVHFFFVFLLATLRYGVGVDYFQYENLFDNAYPIWDLSLDYFLYNQHSIEWGYLLLESLIKSFTPDYAIFLLIYNFILFYFLYKGIKNYSNYNIQLFLFYCFILPIYAIEAYRQAMAMVIFLYNSKNLLNGNLYKYSFWVLVGFLFHKVSLLLLPLYFLVRITIFRKVSFLIVLIVLSFLISYFDLVGKFIEFLFLYFGDSSLVKRVHLYYFIKHDPSLTIGFVAYLQRFIIISIALFYRNLFQDKIIQLILFYPITYFIFSNVGVLAGRISAIFLVFYLIYFGGLLSKDIKLKPFIFIFLILYGSSIFYKDIHTYHKDKEIYTHIPYKNVLFDR